MKEAFLWIFALGLMFWCFAGLASLAGEEKWENRFAVAAVILTVIDIILTFFI